MPEMTQKQFKELLKEVAVTKSTLKVVFPWGFQVVEFKGEKVLQPLTPDEYHAAATNDPGKPLTDLEITGRPGCPCKLTNTTSLSPKCSEAGGGWCSYHYSDGKYYSICSYL